MRKYTLDEARELLPRVRPVLEQVRRSYRRLRTLQAAKGADARSAQGDGHTIVDAFEATAALGEPERLQAALREGIQQLNGWGIELKDPARGLIDFYHERDGETVYLCYLLGEEDIVYWHRLEAGFAGRQPL